MSARNRTLDFYLHQPHYYNTKTMTSLQDRPRFGDIYVASGCSYLSHHSRAVRVVGWTSKQAIVESLPLLSRETVNCPVQSSDEYHIDIEWLDVHPLPPVPVPKTGAYQLLQIKPRYISPHMAPPAADDTVELRDPTPLRGQTLNRCEDVAAWRGDNTHYY